jgi:holliday junction DNA helicase RuvA
VIASLTGRVASIAPDSVVVTVGGVGMLAMVTPASLAQLRSGTDVTLHTSLVVREDSLTLFGFLDEDERSLFELLQTASGVGPRLAQAMLAVHSPETLRRAVLDEDFKTLEHVPGIGRKGAQRIVLELKDRIGSPRSSQSTGAPRQHLGWRDQVHSALIGLGFSTKEASEAIDIAANEINDDEIDIPSILKSALRSRGRG